MHLEELKKYLESKKADYEFISHNIPIISRKDALNIFKIEEMAPTLILKSENCLYALIISGTRDKVDFKKIKNLLNINRLELAQKEEISLQTDLKAGKIPLTGHGLPCIIDKVIYDFEYVYGGSGDFYHTLKIAPKNLKKLNNVILEFK